MPEGLARIQFRAFCHKLFGYGHGEDQQEFPVEVRRLQLCCVRIEDALDHFVSEIVQIFPAGFKHQRLIDPSMH